MTQERSGKETLRTDQSSDLRNRKAMVIRIILLAAAAAMIVAGVLNGSMKDVLIKAINLCTECIGLG